MYEGWESVCCGVTGAVVFGGSAGCFAGVDVLHVFTFLCEENRGGFLA